MADDALAFLVPGDIDTRSGGYGYDRHMIAGLRQRGWQVSVVQVPGGYPVPSGDERREAARLLAELPDGALAIVDGLAAGALPDELSRERTRLRFIALVHHPLGLETGLAAAEAARLLASERQALGAARGVIVTSARTVEAVRQLGVARGSIAVVEPGTDARPPSAGSGAGSTALLCVASITPRKGHDTLVAALEGIATLDWQLTCVGGAPGDGEWARAIRRRIDASGLADRIAFAGELSGAALEDAYARADLFVLPTRYEGYGMAVAEALAHGLPVVSTPTGAIPELVGDTAGFLVGADDPAALGGVIRLFMTDRMVRARMRQGALRVRGTLRDWNAAAAQLEEAIRRFAAA